MDEVTLETNTRRKVEEWALNCAYCKCQDSCGGAELCKTAYIKNATGIYTYVKMTELLFRQCANETIKAAPLRTKDMAEHARRRAYFYCEPLRLCRELAKKEQMDFATCELFRRADVLAMTLLKTLKLEACEEYIKNNWAEFPEM